MKKAGEVDYLKGDLFPMILKFSIPAAVSLLITAVYNIVDRMFIGNFSGTSALAGLSVCFPLSKYDKAVWDQLVYKNCNNIIDGFKKSYNSGIKCELRLDGISSEHKRVVRHNYFEALKDILDTEDIVYDMNDINEIAKRRGDLDGKCEIRFPDEWNE